MIGSEDVADAVSVAPSWAVPLMVGVVRVGPVALTLSAMVCDTDVAVDARVPGNRDSQRGRGGAGVQSQPGELRGGELMRRSSP